MGGRGCKKLKSRNFSWCLLPTLKCPSCSAIDPRLTLSIIAPLRDGGGNVMPPTIFKPKISSPSIFFLNIIWPIMRWPSAEACQLTGFCNIVVCFFYFEKSLSHFLYHDRDYFAHNCEFFKILFGNWWDPKRRKSGKKKKMFERLFNI